jgi:hypothetical protein
VLSFQVGTWDAGTVDISVNISLPHSHYSQFTDGELLDDNCATCIKAPANTIGTTYAYIAGNPMLYAFLPIHHREFTGQACSSRVSTLGFELMDAVMWSVKQINTNSELLQSSTLGLAIFDTCELPNASMDLAKGVLFPSFLVHQGAQSPDDPVVLGFIGSSSDSTTIAINKGISEVHADVPMVCIMLYYCV